MRNFKPLFLAVAFLFLLSCQGPYHKSEKKPLKIGMAEAKVVEEDENAEEEEESAEDIVDLDNKGVGPIESVDIDDDIDQDMADAGEEHFNGTCIACHQMDSRMVGPAMAGVTKRRSPEWIMNMIMDPDQMLEEDPIAMKLLDEFQAPMTNLGLSEEETREILEYFRAYDN